MNRLRFEAFWEACTYVWNRSHNETILRTEPGAFSNPLKLRLGALLGALCFFAPPLAAQNFRPSSQVEALAGTGEFDLDTEGTTTAVVFVEASTQDIFVAVSNDGALTWSSPVQVNEDLFGAPKRLLRGAA